MGAAFLVGCALLPTEQNTCSPSAAHAPDGLDLNGLLIAHPLSTFTMRVRGHRLRRWGVHDGNLLLVDRAIEHPLPLNPENLLDNGLFGVAAAVVHHLVRRRALPLGGRAMRCQPR